MTSKRVEIAATYHFLFLTYLTVVLFTFTSITRAANAPLRDVEQVLEALERKLETISTYTCKLHSTVISGIIKEERVFEYAFNRPRLIRMRVIEGNDRGSVLVYKNGKVRGRRGGLISWVVLTYEPSDRDVVSVRGGRIDQSDLLFIMEVLRNAKRGKKIVLNRNELVHGKMYYRLDLLQHVEPLEAGASKGSFWVDSEDLVVSQYELYDLNGQLIYRQVHEHVQLNASLSKQLFEM